MGRDLIREICEKKLRNIPLRDWVQPSTPRWELVSNRISRIRAILHAINVLNSVCYSLDIEEIKEFSKIIENEIPLLDGIIVENEILAVHYTKEVSEEISCYIPIGLVACIEAYFRQVYADLIDFGDPYKKNAADFSDIKFTIKTAISLEREGLSIGDFIAHLLSINRFENIDSTMTRLIGNDFSKEMEEEIANTNEPQQVELMFGDKKDYIAKGYDIVSEDLVIPTSKNIYHNMVCDIRNMFELRHKLCHEANSSMTDHDKYLISKAPDSTLKFLVVSEAVVERLLS